MADFPWLGAAGLQRLFDIYAGAGCDLRAVGGCVRDSLLAMPVSDIDLCANCPPDKGLAILRDAGIKTVPTGLQHGTITAVIDHIPYEITTLRRDVETDGRHAAVVWTDDWQTDAARRDFTINALYLDRQGQVYDWFGGLEDLATRRLRFVGVADQRIQEDYLRILRFYRFSARFSGQLDAAGHLACLDHLAGLKGVSVERIWSEIKKLLVADYANPVVSAMMTDGVFAALTGKETGQGCRIQSLPSDAVLRLVSLLPEAKNLAADWKMSTAEGRLLLGYSDAALADKVAAADMAGLQQLAWAFGPDIIAGHLYLQEREEAAAIAAFAPPVFPVKGRDLIAAGITPGPDMGQVLQDLQDHWLASTFQLDQAALLAKINKP